SLIRALLSSLACQATVEYRELLSSGTPRPALTIHIVCSAISSPLMQHALFGLFTAILALKRPYLALDLWVQRSTHEIGPPPAVWANNRLSRGRPNIRG